MRLAGPLIVNNLAMAGMQFADAVMAGKLGAEALAAVAIGSSVWFLFFMVLLGVMMALSPIVARQVGAGTEHLVGEYTQQAALLGLFLSLPVILAGQFVIPDFLVLLTIDVAFRDLTAGYVGAIVWGAPAIFVFLALRFTNEGISYTTPIMATSIFALVANVFLNWVFMYGKLGAPALGAVGCGVASAITMWLVALSLLLYMRVASRYAPYQLWQGRLIVNWSVCHQILRLGVPIAVTVTAEAGLFNAVSLLMGTLGASVAAAHQIALNFASTAFMIPLAISAATTVRVGYWLGRDQATTARLSGRLGIVSCTLVMCVSAVLLLLGSDLIVTFYTSDATVKTIAVSLLLVAAIFQIADGLQVGAAGALRGYKDAKLPMIITTFSYWVVAFPLAFMAAVVWRMDPHYVWGGFVVGLCLAGILLGIRFVVVSRNNQAGQLLATD